MKKLSTGVIITSKTGLNNSLKKVKTFKVHSDIKEVFNQPIKSNGK